MNVTLSPALTEALVIFNLGFGVLACLTNAVQVAKDWKYRSRFRWLRVAMVAMLVTALGLFVYTFLVPGMPAFTPLRLSFSLLWIYPVVRGLYDLFTR